MAFLQEGQGKVWVWKRDICLTLFVNFSFHPFCISVAGGEFIIVISRINLGEPFAWGTKLVTGKATGAGSQFVTNPLPLVSLLIYPSVNRVFLGSAIPLVPEPIVFALELDVGQELNGFMCREGFPIRFCRWRLQRGGGIEHSLGSSLQGLAVSEDPA